MRPAEAASPTELICPFCTFVNEKLSNKCEVCGGQLFQAAIGSIACMPLSSGSGHSRSDMNVKDISSASACTPDNGIDILAVKPFFAREERRPLVVADTSSDSDDGKSEDECCFSEDEDMEDQRGEGQCRLDYDHIDDESCIKKDDTQEGRRRLRKCYNERVNEERNVGFDDYSNWQGDFDSDDACDGGRGEVADEWDDATELPIRDPDDFEPSRSRKIPLQDTRGGSVTYDLLEGDGKLSRHSAIWRTHRTSTAI